MVEVKKKIEKDIFKKPDNFDELICRFIIRGTLTNITQLHVGAGGAETEFSIDNPLIRLKIGDKQVPYIPGTSLKGIIRTEIERYLKSDKDYETFSFEKICYPYINDSDCNTGEIQNICLACRIFGNSQVGSHIIISDAILDTENFAFPGVKTKPGNAINRITGAAQSGQLYDIEALQPGGVFNFEIQIINIDLSIDNIITRALKFILKELQEGWIQVGGKRSTGFGQIKIKEAKIIEMRPKHLMDLKFDEYSLEHLMG
ncbi:MAG: CRISPR-associated RAMP protein Csx7 [Candidatus Lokiarchaeia archaeon]